MRRQYRIFDQPYLHFIRSIWTTNTALFIQKSITLNVSFNPFIMNIHSAIKFKKNLRVFKYNRVRLLYPQVGKAKGKRVLGSKLRPLSLGLVQSWRFTACTYILPESAYLAKSRKVLETKVLGPAWIVRKFQPDKVSPSNE